MPQDFFDKPERYPEYERMRASVDKRGFKWITGLDPETMDSYLDSLGLKLLEDVGAEYYLENYIKPLNRGSLVMRIERAALAEVKG
jgi:O-methyltransferase involved in polyketide biosynthesis